MCVQITTKVGRPEPSRYHSLPCPSHTSDSGNTATLRGTITSQNYSPEDGVLYRIIRVLQHRVMLGRIQPITAKYEVKARGERQGDALNKCYTKQGYV